MSTKATFKTDITFNDALKWQRNIDASIEIIDKFTLELEMCTFFCEVARFLIYWNLFNQFPSLLHLNDTIRNIYCSYYNTNWLIYQ